MGRSKWSSSSKTPSARSASSNSRDRARQAREFSTWRIPGFFFGVCYHDVGHWRGARLDFQRCPHCDAPLNAQQVCCRHCGSDLETGWRDAGDIEYASVMLPEDDDEMESEQRSRSVPRQKRIGLLILGLLLAGAAPVFFQFTPWLTLALWLALGLLLGRVQSS